MAHHIDVQNLMRVRITKVVDPAGIDRKKMLLPGEISITIDWQSGEVSRSHSSGWLKYQTREGPNMEQSFSDPVLLPNWKPNGGYWQDGQVQEKTRRN